MGGSSRKCLGAGACALALAVGWSAPAAAGTLPQPANPPAKMVAGSPRDRPGSERGVVQSVSASGLMLKTLDGSTVAAAVDARTRVLIDGKPASILDVHPGFVAVVRPGTATGNGSGQKAGELREVFAFAPARQRGAHLYSGAVASVSVHAIALRARSGGTFRLALAANTRVFLDGTPASIDAVEPGDVAVVRTGPRREVWTFRRGLSRRPGA
jgi:hypothetical protein